MVMKILHAGGTADTAYESTTNAIQDISRGSVLIDRNQSYVVTARDPDTGIQTSFTKGWAHFVWYTRWCSGSGAVPHTFKNTAGTPVLRCETLNNGTTFAWKLATSTDGTNWVDIPGATGQEPGEGLRTVDYFIDAEAGQVAYYRNGVMVCDVPAPNLIGMNISQMDLRNANDQWYGYQQTLLATGESTIGCNVRTRYAVGQGDDTAWTGTFADVDEFPYSDDDYLTAANVGDRESFVANTLPALPVGNEVKGVVIAARFRNNGGTPANIRPYLFIGGVRYHANNFPDASAGWAPGVTVFSNNPATNAPWGKDINTVNVQFGIEATE
jgi:hypothetical protein